MVPPELVEDKTGKTLRQAQAGRMLYPEIVEGKAKQGHNVYLVDFPKCYRPIHLLDFFQIVLYSI